MFLTTLIASVRNLGKTPARPAQLRRPSLRLEGLERREVPSAAPLAPAAQVCAAAPAGPTIQMNVNQTAIDTSKLHVQFQPGVALKSALPGTTVVIQRSDPITGACVQGQPARGATGAQALKAYSSVPGVEAQANHSLPLNANGPTIPHKVCWFSFSVQRYRRVLGSQKCYIGKPVVYHAPFQTAMNQRLANQLAKAWRAQGFLVDVKPIRMG